MKENNGGTREDCSNEASERARENHGADANTEDRHGQAA
jgi:hypothetical protein